MFQPNCANASCEPSGYSQVDVWNNSTWFRMFLPHRIMFLVETLFKQVNKNLLFLYTLNTYCLHVHIGCMCTLEISEDLNYRIFTAKGWADLQQEYWTIEWDVDPSRAEKSQSLKDEYISRSWATPTVLHHDYQDQNEGLSFSLVLGEDAGFFTPNDTDTLNIILNYSVSFSWWCIFFFFYITNVAFTGEDGRWEAGNGAHALDRMQKNKLPAEQWRKRTNYMWQYVSMLMSYILPYGTKQIS